MAKLLALWSISLLGSAAGFRSDAPWSSDVRRKAQHNEPHFQHPKAAGKHLRSLFQRRSCVSIPPFASGSWCNANCNNVPPSCPASLCKCSDSPPAPAPGPSPGPAPGPAPGPTPAKPTPALAPTPGGPIPKPDFNEIRVAYFAEWAIYGRSFNPWDMDLQRLSHVNYAFFDLTPSCKVVSGDPYATTDKKNAEVGQTWSSDAMPGGTMGAFRIMRCGDDVPNCDVAKANGHYYPHIKLLVSLGGWTWSKQFSQCTKDAGRRRTFVSSAVDAMEEHHLDGLDFDWEYPTGCLNNGGSFCGLSGNTYNADDWANYISLLKEVRAEMKARSYTPCLDNPANEKCKYITTAAGMSPVLNDAKAPIKEWVDNQDFVNLMTYDYHGAWQNVSAHQTALYTVPNLPASIPKDFNIDDTVKVFLDKGVPARKMTIGLAAYGRGWGDTTAANYNREGPCQNSQYGGTCSLAPGTWEAGVYSYWDIKATYLAAGWTRHFDPDAQAPYITGKVGGKDGLIVYDDPESIQKKVQWAKSKGFGGFMWWESSDDPNFELHAAAIDAWNGRMHSYHAANGTEI